MAVKWCLTVVSTCPPLSTFSRAYAVYLGVFFWRMCFQILYFVTGLFVFFYTFYKVEFKKKLSCKCSLYILGTNPLSHTCFTSISFHQVDCLFSFFFETEKFLRAFLIWLSGKESTCQCRRNRFDPWSFIQENPTCLGATKPTHHNCLAYALEPKSCNYWSQRDLEPMHRVLTTGPPGKSPRF